MIANANLAHEGMRLNIDTWDFYLNQALPAGKTAPDPMPIFVAAIGPDFDRSAMFNAQGYWAIMAPALRSQLGLSGLGVYGGLGAIARGRW
jgi:hypothetical protein